MKKILSTLSSFNFGKETINIKVELPQICPKLEMTENSIKVEQVVNIVKVEEESANQHIDIDKCISSPKQELVDTFQSLNEKQVSMNSSILLSQQIRLLLVNKGQCSKAELRTLIQSAIFRFLFKNIAHKSCTCVLSPRRLLLLIPKGN